MEIDWMRVTILMVGMALLINTLGVFAALGVYLVAWSFWNSTEDN